MSANEKPKTASTTPENITCEECRDCLLKLVKTASEMAAPHDPKLSTQAEVVGLKLLTSQWDVKTPSPVLANIAFREIKKITANNDPYAEFKSTEIETARNAFQRLSMNIENNLDSGLRMAALGNSLDFFKSAQDVMNTLQNMQAGEFSFYHDDTELLIEHLENHPELVLYLADNSGEIFFDQPLFNYLKTKAEKLILIVKGGPALNDLTRRELKKTGLEKTFNHVADTGTDGVGIDWPHASPDFLSLVNNADLIISKGMANFETLYDSTLAAPIFFIFKAKCNPVRNWLNAPLNSYWALWKNGVS